MCVVRLLHGTLEHCNLQKKKIGTEFGSRYFECLETIHMLTPYKNGHTCTVACSALETVQTTDPVPTAMCLVKGCQHHSRAN